MVAGFGPRFLEQEVQVEGVLALEAFEVALVQLRGGVSNLNTPGVGWWVGVRGRRGRDEPTKARTWSGRPS